MDNITFNAEELSEYLTISRSMVYQMARENNIPCIKFGRKVLFRKSTIDKWLEEQENRCSQGGT